MNLKSAAFLALVGTLLVTLVLAVDFINLLIGVLRDIVPAVAVFRALIYLLGGLSLVAFFYTFHRAQPR